MRHAKESEKEAILVKKKGGERGVQQLISQSNCGVVPRDRGGGQGGEGISKNWYAFTKEKISDRGGEKGG